MSRFTGRRMLSRRTAVAGLGVGGLGIALGARGSGVLAAQDATPEAGTPAPLLGETYVGEVAILDAFVAIVLGAAPGDQPQARAYLCDGDAIDEWFTEGTVSADALRMSSEGGAALEATRTAEGMTGSVTLPGEEPVAFAAAPAEGIAGLYDVVLTPDGLIRGTSAAGGRLEGVMAQTPLEDPPERQGLYPIIGFLTPPGGQPERFAALAMDAESAEARWIVLADGQAKGGKKKGTGRGFVDPDGQP